jgi:D-serine deaminase-like pyridoxal phosphate-dependent protein
VPLQLDRILATPVGGDTVGAPPFAATTVGAVAEQGWSLRDLSPPVVTLRSSAVAHNLSVMQAWTSEHGVELYPHGKTTMAPQLWERQLQAGADGITGATPAQIRAMHGVGVPRMFLANEFVDRDAIAWVAQALGTIEFACWVDSTDGIAVLADAVASSGAETPVRVLVEVGHRGGRTGARSFGAAIEVADAVARRSELSLVGVAGYEGTIGHERTAAVLSDVDAFVALLGAVAERLVTSGPVDGEPIISAGGSLFFDRVAVLADRGRVVLRSGCTITHDHGLYARGSPLSGGPGPRFRPAIEAWGSVLSRPEPEVAVIGLGKRDVAFDVDAPIPLRMRDDDRSLDGMVVERLMDQHAICRVPASLPLAPGEIVAFGISHPCAAFDRRRVLFELDDDDRVIGAVATLF